MVTKQAIDEQLKKIGVNHYGWGRTELRELPNIILSEEEIFECVNGIYEGGFALLVATNLRVLLVDKKPLNYLTVEDLRFDMINEIDYSHRLFGARISISTGSKNLQFTSFNQPRLRKLISHVQHCMAEGKLKQSEHQEEQRSHLEQINQQLQSYLLAQHQQQQKFQEQLQAGGGQSTAAIEPVRPAPALADYLYAQSLLAEHDARVAQGAAPKPRPDAATLSSASTPTPQPRIAAPSQRPAADDLYNEGVQEIFGKRQQSATPAVQQTAPRSPQPAVPTSPTATSPGSPLLAPIYLTTSAIHHALDINPLRVAYSKLPMAMRNRRFGRPSFHAHSAHSQTEIETEPSMAAPPSSEIAPAHS